MNQPIVPVLSWITYGTPVPQGSKRLVGAQRLGVARARLIDVNSHALKEWRTAVATDAASVMAEVGWVTLEDLPVKLTADFTVLPPKDIARKITKTPALPWPSHRMPDLDKEVRAVMDAITNAGVWTDDRLVAKLSATKRYAGSHGALDSPGVLVTVQEWKP